MHGSLLTGNNDLKIFKVKSSKPYLVDTLTPALCESATTPYLFSNLLLDESSIGGELIGAALFSFAHHVRRHPRAQVLHRQEHLLWLKRLAIRRNRCSHLAGE